LVPRIEICGGISSGKTTLANLLKTSKVEPLFENFRANPFWEDFYSNPGQHIFETEITFLLQHYHEIKQAEQPSKILACDFSLYLDLAFAKIGLKGPKYNAFCSVYDEAISELDYPNILIYLKCDAEILLDRIRARGREIEKNITSEFLKSLDDALKNEIDKIKNHSKVIIINSGELNFVDDNTIRKNIAQNISDELQKIK
jgi:deoxyguanosine kinase